MSVPSPAPRRGMDFAVAGGAPPSLPKPNRLDEFDRPSFTWICLGCGFHHRDEHSPARCPRCTGANILSGFTRAD